MSFGGTLICRVQDERESFLVHEVKKGNGRGLPRITQAIAGEGRRGKGGGGGFFLQFGEL